MTARYQLLADQLIQAIKRGEYQPGQRLPTIRALAAKHGEKTALWAMQMLTTEGWAVATTGSGTYVADPLPEEGRTLEERVAELERRMNEHEGHHPNG